MSTAIAPINTKKVVGRRNVHYASYADFIADAENLAGRPIDTLGNWTQAQIYQHLAISLDTSIDGSPFVLPAPARWLMSLLMKKKFLTKAIPPGFKTSKKLVASDQTSLTDALADLRRAIERQMNEPNRAIHPGFGRITREEWDQFNLRHAEEHMSFLVPVEQTRPN